MLKQRSIQVWAGPAVARTLGCGLSSAVGLLAAGLLLGLAGGRAASAAPSVCLPVVTTIQAAIDAAPGGATVCIPAGTYTESLTLDKAVNLTGALSSTTIVQGLAGQRVLTVTGVAIHSNTVISGLTFTGGDVSGSGGGISVDGNAQPSLEHLVILGNTADTTGGGLFNDAGSPLSLVDVVFISNSAALYGGGVYALDVLTVQGGALLSNQCTNVGCQGGGVSMGNSSALTLFDVRFISNTASSKGGGAQAIGPVTLQGGLFQGNSCSNGCYGGGLVGESTVVIMGTRFISNTAEGSGGGVHAQGAATISGALFQGNRCTQPDCIGGGFTGYGTSDLVDTQFISNSAVGYAGGGATLVGAATVQGGLFQGNATISTTYGGGGLFTFSTLALTNTQFIANHTPGGGGGLRLEAGAGRLVNTLFAGNSATGGGAALATNAPGGLTILHATIVSPVVSSGSAIAVFSGTVGITDTLIASYIVGVSRTGGTVAEDYNLFSGVAVSSTGTLAHGGHSLSGPAVFRNPAAGDYHLGLGSAGINAGANAGVTTDFDGDPRPIGPAADIGFDEARLVTLALSKSDGQASVQSGAILTYTILVNNTGPYTATGLLVGDNLPASLTGGAWTCLASAGSSCPASGSGSISATVTVAGGSFVQFTLHATMSPSANGQIINSVSVSVPVGLVNTNSANESASDTTTIIGGPPIQLYLPLVRR